MGKLFKQYFLLGSYEKINIYLYIARPTTVNLERVMTLVEGLPLTKLLLLSLAECHVTK